MLLKVRVEAGARKERIERTGDTFKIAVREKAEGNRANARIVELVALECGVSRKRVRIVSGHHGPSKIVEVR